MVDEFGFPHYRPCESYTLAITGKAFNFLVKDPTKLATLQRVLLKA